MILVKLLFCLMFVGVAVFACFALKKSMYPVYPSMRAFRAITREAAFTTVTQGMRRSHIYDKDGKVESRVQRRIDDMQDTYLAFLKKHESEFGKVLVQKGWLNEKSQIKVRKSVKIANDFLRFYYDTIEEKA